MVLYKSLHFLLGGLCIICTTACSNNTNEASFTDEALVICVKSSLSKNDVDSISNKISNTINFSTRSIGNEFTENEAKEILKPLTNDGKNIQQQLLGNKEEIALTSLETSLIENMTDDQLAELSFTFNSIYNNAITIQDVKGNKVIDCLLLATGIQDISDVFKDGLGIGCVSNYYNGTKALMTVKGARKLITAFARRTCGWIGVAWMIYDFGDCINRQ